MPAISSARTKTLLQAVTIAAAVFIIYFPVFHGDWLWDDGTLILKNRAIHDSTGLAAIWTSSISGTEYLPLTSSVEWLEWHAWGSDTLGYHLTSVLLHLVSAVLVWRLFDKLGLRSAWLGGLLFAIHPVAVESVAWISELKNTLSLPPFLLAMCTWVDHTRTGKRSDFFQSLAWFLIAMLAKPTMLMFPLVIPLFAWWRRGRIVALDILSALTFLAISITFGILATNLQGHGAESSLVNIDAWSRLATAGWQIPSLLGKCVLPMHLLPLYPSGLITPASVFDVFPWFLLAATLGLLWATRNSWGRGATLGLGFFLFNLLPVLGFIAANATTMIWSMEHLIYIPLIGIIGLMVAACDAARARLPSTLRSWAAGALGIGFALFGLQSHSYAAVFTNPGKLWSAVLAGNPNSAVAHNNLGLFLLNQGKIPEATDHFESALRIKPDYAFAHNGLANSLVMGGHNEEAITHYREALKINPDYPEAHNGLGNVLLEFGRLDEAHAECEQALKLAPHYVEAYCTLGLIDAKQGKIAEAIQQFKTAQQLRPSDARIATELDYLRAQKGQ